MNEHDVKAPPAWAIVLAFAIIYVSWGTTYLAIRVAVYREQLPPALFGGSRLACAGLILLGFQAATGQSLRVSRRTFLRLLGISLLLFLLGNWLIAVAQTRVPSGVAAVLVATTPLWMALLAMLWPEGERLHLRGWLGLVIGLAGVTLLFAPKLQAGDPLDAADTPFLLLVLASSLAWAVGSLLLRHVALPISHLTSAGYQMLLGGGAQVLIGLALGEVDRVPEQLTGPAVGSFFYLLVVGSLAGFVAFNWLLGHVSAAKVGTYAYVNPVIAVAVGWFDGEAVTGWIVAGIVVILSGVYLVRGEKRPAELGTVAE